MKDAQVDILEHLRRFNPTVPEGHYYMGYRSIDRPALEAEATAWLAEEGIQHPHQYAVDMLAVEHVEMLIELGRLDHEEWARRGYTALGFEEYIGETGLSLWSGAGGQRRRKVVKRLIAERKRNRGQK